MGRNKSEILAVLVVGVLMSAIDITIVILALPTIDSGLHSGIALSIWVIMAYILVMTVLSTQVGKLGDKFGRAKLFNYGLGIFVVGSALCGLSPDIYALIGFRALQAVGGALIGTSSSAVVSDNFEPHERGKAFGFTSLGWNLGSIFGIFLGGLLATINWRLIFLINVPIGIVLLPISIRKLRDVKESIKERFDILGSLILAAGLFALTIAAVYSIYSGIGLPSLVMISASILLFIAFIIRERMIRFGIIDFGIFKNRIFTFSVLSSMLQFTASFSVLFVLILYLQGVRALNPFIASIFLLPGYAMGAIFGPKMGRVSDRIGARVPATLGLIAILGGYILYIIFVSATSPLYFVALITLLTGIGSGTFYPANISAIMANAPHDKYGMASGVNRMLGNVGMILSFAIALTVMSASIPRADALSVFLGTEIGGLPSSVTAPFMNGLHTALIASAIMLVACIIMSAFRGHENRQEISKIKRIDESTKV